MEDGSGKKTLTQTMGLDAGDQQAMKAFVRFTDADSRTLKNLSSLIEKQADRIVDKFYKNIEHYPELMQVIERAGSNIDRLKAAQKSYLLEMFGGDYGDAYFERRLRIGEVHNRIGLTPRWYLGSYAVYVEEITILIQRRFRFNNAARERALLAVNKIIQIDSQLAINTYIHGVTQDLKGVSMSRDEIEARVREYGAHVQMVAEGHLTQRLEAAGDDELAVLGVNLNGMTESLAGMASGVADASSTMFTTLEELKAAVGTQATGASQQATAVNETATTMAEIKATSAQTLSKAQQFGDVAERTRREGEQGAEAVEEAIRGIESIREASLASQQIVAAVRQEVAGIDQVNTAMNEINKVTAQFLTGAQQSLEATESLSGVAGQLQKSVASYTM